MMDLESTTVKQIGINWLLPTMNETNIFGFVIPNEDDVTIQLNDLPIELILSGGFQSGFQDGTSISKFKFTTFQARPAIN